MVEVAAEIADFVIAVGKVHGNFKIAFAQLLDFLLQFHQRPLDLVSQHHQKRAANGNCSGSSHQKHGMALRITPGKSCQQEQKHPAQQDTSNWNQRLDLPVDAWA